MENTFYCFEGQGELISPQLVYYKEIIQDNINKTIDMAGDAKRLWPHIKTHKMLNVVKMKVNSGITRFKCATISEMEIAAEGGATHVLLAYPLIGPNIERYFSVFSAFPEVKFYAMADDTTQVQILAKKAETFHVDVEIFMDVDIGQHRTGVALQNVVELYSQWNAMNGINLVGLHCYDGHRHESSRSIRDAHVKEIDLTLSDIKNQLILSGFAEPMMIMGGTPSFPCHATLTKDFLSPGTCIIQDAGYKNNYSDLPFIPAALVLTRVISRPNKDSFTIDLGTKAVASDPKCERGEIVGMEYAETVLQNEEHWVLKVPSEHIKDIPPIGTELFVIPTHVCPTTALYPNVPIVANRKVIDWWEVSARNRKINF